MSRQWRPLIVVGMVLTVISANLSLSGAYYSTDVEVTVNFTFAHHFEQPQPTKPIQPPITPSVAPPKEQPAPQPPTPDSTPESPSITTPVTDEPVTNSPEESNEGTDQ